MGAGGIQARARHHHHQRTVSGTSGRKTTTRMPAQRAAETAAAAAALRPAGVRTRSKTKLSSNGGGHGAPAGETTTTRTATRTTARTAATNDAAGGTEKIFTVPTILTLTRVAAIPFVVLAYAREGPGAVALCTTLYVLACFTDWLDGYIARATGTFSKFGAFLDPVSDKLMVTVILILVTFRGPPEGLCGDYPFLVPLAAGVIICREVAMSALREWAASAGSEVRSAVAVNSLGKWKTALQMTSLGFLLACREGTYGGNPALVAMTYLGPVFLLASAALATYSFAVYFKAIWRFMRT